MPIEEISQHEAQLVEIAKALWNEPAILVMDEPTSALSREEVELLFQDHRTPQKRGARNRLYFPPPSGGLPDCRPGNGPEGRKKDRYKARCRGYQTGRVQMMVGKSIAEFYTTRATRRERNALRVENLTRYGFFHEASFTAYEGEVVGIGGLSGAGRSELARVLAGLDDKDEGEVYFCTARGQTAYEHGKDDGKGDCLFNGKPENRRACVTSFRSGKCAGDPRPRAYKAGIYNQEARVNRNSKA